MYKCIDCIREFDEEPKIQLSFTYKDEFGYTTTLTKMVERNYLDEPNELAVVNRVYQEFLTACTFTVSNEDVVIILPEQEAYELGLVKDVI